MVMFKRSSFTRFFSVPVLTPRPSLEKGIEVVSINSQNKKIKN